MAYEETELQQAGQLDRIVENIIQGDCDLFEGVEARRLSRGTMAVVDLATFAMPLDIAGGKAFEQRVLLLVDRKARGLVSDQDRGCRKDTGAWSRFRSLILGVGLAAAAFCASLFLEPMPVGHGGCSIDTFSRSWYNDATSKYSVVSAGGGARRVSFFGFSDAGSEHGATACR